MMKFIYAILALLIFSTCSTSVKKGLHLFDAEADSTFTVIGHQEIGDGIVWITDTSDVHTPPVFQMIGDWDLSAYSHIKVVLISGNKTENINATFRMEGNGAKTAEGSLDTKISVRSGDTIEWLIPLVPSLEYPEILDSLKGLRATPFSLDGVTSTIDPTKVTKILISFDKWLKGSKLGIKEVLAIQGKEVSMPLWFELSQQDFFPFIDQYGQFIHKDWPGKTKRDEDLRAELQKELDEMESIPAPDDRSPYGGWLKGKKLEATGNFQVQKVDGKWWMVDPDGHLFWSNGVVRVTPSSAVTIIDEREDYFSSLPNAGSPYAEFYTTRDEFLYTYYQSWGVKTFDFSAANIRTKYGENWRTAYSDMLFKRLKNWGMNTLSAGSAKEIYREDRVPYCDRIELKTARIDGAPDRLNVIRDPFHADFGQKFAEQLKDRKEELESAWCYGYFVDNKLVWGADHDLGRWVLKSSADQPAKKVFVSDLQHKYSTITALNAAWKSAYDSWEDLLSSRAEPSEGSFKDCTDFSARLIDQYFKSVAEVMRQVAPGKLYLGCRYVTVNARVLEIAARYCDVLTFDLFWDSLADFKLPQGVDKPVLIGEFHFGALDRGLFHPGLNQKANQEERALAYEKYMRSALNNPFVIGTAWHQFSDQATTGRFDGENFQDGLTDICDRVYPETIAKVREIGNNLYQIRTRK